MKVTCQDIGRLEGLSESDFEYGLLAEHLDTCIDCQQQLDSQCSSALVTDIVQQVRSAGETPFPAPQAELIEQEVSRLQPPRHPELLGRLGRYDIERTVGRGGMGVVYKAMDTELHRVVAVKALAGHLATNAAARLRFAREAQAAAAVLHPNVIPIYNVEAVDAAPYLVMQFIAGESLQSRVERVGPLSVLDVLRIGKQAAEGLAAAHDQGLVHRDVKPANILLEDQTDRVVLSDFGLARSADDASLTQTGIVAGTPHYMSPEQATGLRVTAQSDLFALGSVLYFALSGRPPFRAESAMGVLNCICTRPHRPLSQVNESVPRELAQLVDRLLSKKAPRRYGSAQQVAECLESILSRLQQGRIRLVGQTRWFSRPIAGAFGCVLVAAALWGFAQFLGPAWIGPSDASAPQRSTDTVAADSAATPRDRTLPAAEHTEPRQWLLEEVQASDRLRGEIQEFNRIVGEISQAGELSPGFLDLPPGYAGGRLLAELDAIEEDLIRSESELKNYKKVESYSPADEGTER